MIPVVLCADIGTSSLKAALINLDESAGGRLAAFTRIPYPQDVYAAVIERRRPPTPLSSAWEDALRRAVSELRRAAPRADINAVCISGNGPTLVPVSRAGGALYTLNWFGMAAAAPPEARSLFLPRAAWFRENYPALFEKTARIFSCQEWLLWRLGAEPVTALPTPEYRPFYWDEAQCAAFNFDAALFPRFVPLGACAGGVSPAAAAAFKLPEGAPLIAGGPDFIMALLGTGTAAAGLVCDRAGSSEGINVCVDAAERGRIAALNAPVRILPHAREGLWNISVVIPEAGSLFERWREETGQSQRDYGEILAEIIPQSDAPPHPVLARIARQVRDALDVLKNAGLSISEMRISGGQAKNDRWNALKARLTGCTLLAPEILDAELAGDAACALAALGRAPDIHEACRRIVRITSRWTPS